MRKVLLLCLLALPVPAVIPDAELQKIVERIFPKDDRMKGMKLPEIVRALQIDRGSQVADVGAGGGNFSVILGHVVGPEGRVYAVDVGKKSLKEAQKRAKKEKLKNVKTVLGTDEDPKLPSNLDAVLAVITYHEWKKHEPMLTKVHQALKPGGRFVMIEMMPKRTRERGRAVHVKNHVFAPEVAIPELEKAGFKIIERRENFIDDPDQETAQWLVVAAR